MMESKKVEWFAILEPCTKEEIYVNMFTGECVWHPPPGALIKKSDDNLWWEIFDPKSSRFYYYNAANQKTVWQKPQNSDVLSLSKLQTLKQSINDPQVGDAKKESTSTQTSAKISAKHLQKNPMFQKSASTQTASIPSPGREKMRHSFSSRSEHALSAYSYDSGCPGDSSLSSQSHISVDSNNYHCYRKLQFCSAESVDSSYFQDQNIVQPPRISWQESKQWNDRGANLEFNNASNSGHSIQRPMLANIVPVWKQHSFECWQAPPPSTPKQHSLDSASSMSRRHASQQLCQGKSCINFSNTNEQKRRSTPQHYRKVLSKNSLSFGLDQIKHAPSYIIENNTTYPPEAVGTPLASRKQWFVKSSLQSDINNSRKAESNSSSPQSPLMPLENLQSFNRGKSNMQVPVNKYADHNSRYKQQHSLDLPLHSYNTRNVQRKDARYMPELIMPQSVQHRTKISPDFKIAAFQRENMLSRQKYYNSCKHIYTCQNDHSGLCTTPDFNMPCCYQAENYLSPLQQYLMEQAKLSGNLTDFADDKDSFSQSDDDSDGQRDDDDHFADDEGMSRHDSSSLEYLDNYVFFDEGREDIFYSPVIHPSYQKSKSNSQVSVPNFQKGQIAEDAVSSSSAYSTHESNQQSSLPPYYDSYCDKSDEQAEYNYPVEETEEGEVSKGDIQKYAEDNLNRHTKGIFRKKFSLQDMLSWSKDPIRKPMITTTDKSLKRDACEVFKLIQTYMLDHKTKSGQTYEGVVLDLATRGWCKPALRDELYIQICRQTTENPKRESLVLGWELMAVCLTFFPPSIKFQPYLEGYIKKHHQSSSLDPPDLKINHYALVCGKRLEQISHKGAARSLRKPTVEEIEQSRVQIFRPSMFGNTLEEVMDLQRKRYPTYCLPWVQTTLSEAILQLDGAHTEGIFRVPGDIDEINAMKMKIDQWEVIACDDPHVPASLLKQWYRELFEPLIPDEYYEECITYCNDPEAAIQIVKNLPELNRLVFSYLIRFLQVFAAEENCAVTKMDAKNLAMVMAPNCLRCTSEDPTVIFENTRKEMAFIQTLIQHLNTSYMEGIM